MSRPLSVVGRLEEARVQAFALWAELSVHDAREAAAYDVLKVLIEHGDLGGASKVVAKLIEWDQRENALHAEITEPFESKAVVG